MRGNRGYEAPMQQALIAEADSCRLLAAFFYPPDTRLFAGEGVSEKLKECLEISCPEAALFTPSMEDYLEGDGGLELSVAYTRLFLGPPAMLAPPYASYYLDRNAGVMGPSSVEMMKLYSRAGLRIDDEFKEMPDHITVVLEFLYFLLFRKGLLPTGTAPADEAELENTMVLFLKNYFFPWIPEFCGRITAAGEHPFYTALGECLDAFAGHGFNREKAGGP